MEDTLLNKLVALGLLTNGIVMTALTKEGNALIIGLLIGLPLLFSKKNCIK